MSIESKPEVWAHIGPQLAALLVEMMQALDNESDVDDGSEGQPVANYAMHFQMIGARGPGDTWHERTDHTLQFVGIDWRKA